MRGVFPVPCYLLNISYLLHMWLWVSMVTVGSEIWAVIISISLIFISLNILKRKKTKNIFGIIILVYFSMCKPSNENVFLKL